MELCESTVQLAPPHGNLTNDLTNPEIVYRGSYLFVAKSREAFLFRSDGEKLFLPVDAIFRKSTLLLACTV